MKSAALSVEATLTIPELSSQTNDPASAEY